MQHGVARQGSFLQEVICHSVWVFEEGWIPSCQLTTFHVGDEANQISCGRLQADSVQGSGNDLSSRASLALLARDLAGLCSPGVFEPSAVGWCQTPVQMAKSLCQGCWGSEAVLGLSRLFRDVWRCGAAGGTRPLPSLRHLGPFAVAQHLARSGPCGVATVRGRAAFPLEHPQNLIPSKVEVCWRNGAPKDPL